jgi:integrase
MASAWIERRQTNAGEPRYVVRYRRGGRESRPRYAGSFRLHREARTRRDWVAGELAAMRVPELAFEEAATAVPTLAEAAARWQASRLDVAEATRVQHRTALGRALPVLGSRSMDDLAAQDVAALVTHLAEAGKARESIRKTVTALAMVFDHAGIAPNPARDRTLVKLPREEPEEFTPPTAAHVAAVYRLVPSKHRLPLLFLDWSGARVGAIDLTRVGDYDESRRRVRLRAQTTKTRRALWIELPPVLAQALEDRLGPREDRDPEAQLFAGSGADALRTSIAKACKALAIPLFSPHDLRHRRISLLHLSGVPWARIGEFVGQRNLAVTANTYSHVMLEEGEVDYAALAGHSPSQ